MLKTIFSFNKLDFYKLQLNYYEFNTPLTNVLEKNKRQYYSKQLELLNYDAIYRSDTISYYIRKMDYLPYFWRLQRLAWFSRYCNFSVKGFANIILLVAHTDNLAMMAMYFGKKFNQQYALTWLPGLKTNHKMISKYFIKSYDLTYLFNLTKAADFSIFIENNTQQLSVAFRELHNADSGSYPLILFSIDDGYFPLSLSFLTIKSEFKVYYYLTFLFSMLLSNVRNSVLKL